MPYKDLEIRKEKSSSRWKDWAQKNPEKANLRMKEWRHRNPKYMLYISAKRRATKKNIEFTLILEDMPEIPDICPITDIKVFQRDDGTKGPCPNSPTLDRIDPEKGYTPDNIRIISFKANKWKSDMTIVNLQRLLSYSLKEI